MSTVLYIGALTAQGRQLHVRRELFPRDDLSGGRHSCCRMGLCCSVIVTGSDLLLIVFVSME